MSVTREIEQEHGGLFWVGFSRWSMQSERLLWLIKKICNPFPTTHNASFYIARLIDLA